MEITQRQGLVVWVYSLKQIKALRHYGTVMYVSRRMKYVYLYLDAKDVEATIGKLTKLRFVKSVEVSHRPELATSFGQASGAALDDEEDDDAIKARLDEVQARKGELAQTAGKTEGKTEHKDEGKTEEQAAAPEGVAETPQPAETTGAPASPTASGASSPRRAAKPSRNRRPSRQEGKSHAHH